MANRLTGRLDQTRRRIRRLVLLHGAAWLLGAILSQLRWVFAVAVGSFAMSVVCAWFATRYAELYLVFAASLIVLMALPGYVMLKQAKTQA